MTETNIVPADLQAALAEAATNETQREANSSETVTLSIRGKKFRIGDEVLPDEISVIVGASSFENAYYDTPYNPDEPAPPTCFALSVDGVDMKPHENSSDTFSDECNTCPHAQWGSGKTGKGKACKNNRRLALLAYSEETGIQSQVAVMKIPPMSLKAWAGYAKSVALRYKRPTSSVVTKVSFNPNSDFPQLVFDLDHPLESAEDIQYIMSRAEELNTIVLRPYQEPEAKEDVKTTAKRRKKAT